MIEELVELLHIETYKVKGNELQSRCLNPDHDDQHLGNFFINLKSGKYHCFSCGYKGSLLSLLYSKNGSYTQSIRLWNKIRLDENVEYVEPLKVLDKYELLEYSYPIGEYAIKRVGDMRVLEEYDVRSDSNGNPVFFAKRKDGEITGIYVRESDRYYLVEPLNGKFAGILYGEHLPPTDFTVLCEGPFDCYAVRKYLGYKAISGFGTEFSQAQLNKLRKVDNLVIMMDGDYAGRKSRWRLTMNLWNKSDLWVCGGYKKDPDEMGEEICKIFAHKKHIMDFKINQKHASL
jgi:hypothetical protein